jgi:hypothetical protein
MQQGDEKRSQEREKYYFLKKLPSKHFIKGI